MDLGKKVNTLIIGLGLSVLVGITGSSYRYGYVPTQNFLKRGWSVVEIESVLNCPPDADERPSIPFYESLYKTRAYLSIPGRLAAYTEHLVEGNTLKLN